jgi:general secretion pathway protein I
MQGQAWFVDIASFPGDFVNPRAAQFWTPQAIIIKVQSPSGAVIQLETIRLARRTGEQ